MKKAKHLEGITAGEILFEELLRPLNMSQNTLAKALSVPPRRINEIILGKRRITLDTSIRLGRFFGQTPDYWVRIQQTCDLHNAEDLIKKLTLQIKPYKLPKEVVPI